MSSSPLHERDKYRDGVSKPSRDARKQALVERGGGKCHHCGFVPRDEYDYAAFDFHHVNREEKRFHLSAGGLSRAWAVVMREADKCVLLCANCHRRHHAQHPGTHRKGRPRGTGRWQVSDADVMQLFSGVDDMWALCRAIGAEHGMRAHTIYQRVRRTFARHGLSVPKSARRGRGVTVESAPET